MNTPETTSVPPDQLDDLDGHAVPSAEGRNLNDLITVPVPTDLDTEDELERYEAIIADSLTNAFVQAGNALGIIQDKKLYKGQFDNFDAYVHHRWGWRRAHAYRLIQAAQIVGRLSPIGDTLPMPTSESQLRPLSRLDAEKQRTVWMKAVEDAGGRTPTADIVEAAVVGVVGPRKPTTTVTTDPANGKTTGTADGRAPAEHQTPEPEPGASGSPASTLPLHNDPTMIAALPVLAAEPDPNPPAENISVEPVELLDLPALTAATGVASSPDPGETSPPPDGTPAAMNTAPASKTARAVRPETVFHLADGTEIPAEDWVDGWIAAKWIAGMLRDLERQSSSAVPVSAERCARRQRLHVDLAATLNRSGSTPDPEYLRDVEDALGDLRNIVRTHPNYPHPIRTSPASLESDS